MDREALLDHVTNALGAIQHPRFFESERGFQGALNVELQRIIPEHLLPKGAVIEQEYQKRMKEHGLAIRPDLIIHEPYDPVRHAGRDQGNIAVMELKLKASERDALGDFESLIQMMDLLRYPLGIFINIASETAHSDLVPPQAKGRIVCFAVHLRGGRPNVTMRRG